MQEEQAIEEDGKEEGGEGGAGDEETVEYEGDEESMQEEDEQRDHQLQEREGARSLAVQGDALAPMPMVASLRTLGEAEWLTDRLVCLRKKVDLAEHPADRTRYEDIIAEIEERFQEAKEGWARDRRLRISRCS